MSRQGLEIGGDSYPLVLNILGKDLGNEINTLAPNLGITMVIYSFEDDEENKSQIGCLQLNFGIKMDE